jgi:hypothetical protein
MLTADLTKNALRFPIFDGAFATEVASLSGRIFLVGFALNVLEATTVKVGILAALPVSANMARLPGALLLELTPFVSNLVSGA